MSSITIALRRARAAYLKARTSPRLRTYLTFKARLGRFDERMCHYYQVNTAVNAGCRSAICRGYAAGLVPTSTTGGQHATGSYHYRHMAVDFGLRRDLVGTAKGMTMLKTFQRKEHWRHRVGKLPHLVELIGPDNGLVVLRGRETNLIEGTPLETQHDNHVHEAYTA
jgi:hypothetical protein